MISGKASVESVNWAGGEGGGALNPSVGHFLGSKVHLDWLKIDLNVVEIITAQEYKRTKINVNGSTHKQCWS